MKPEDFGIIKYSWCNDVLNCNQDVNINLFSRLKLPFKFGIIVGNFDCRDIGLISLENSPNIVTGSFDCSNNELISLEFGPTYVYGEFYRCSNNILTSLKYAPKNFKGKFICHDNNLLKDENTYEKYFRKLKIQKILESC